MWSNLNAGYRYFSVDMAILVYSQGLAGQGSQNRQPEWTTKMDRTASIRKPGEGRLKMSGQLGHDSRDRRPAARTGQSRHDKKKRKDVKKAKILVNIGLSRAA